MIKFAYTICYVRDVEKTLSFFTNTFSFKIKFITEDKDYAELNTGDTVLAFANEKLGNSNLSDGFICLSDSKKPLGIEIAFVTDEVESTHQHALKNGAKELNPPITKPWGQKVSYIRCPSGILIELCTPMS